MHPQNLGAFCTIYMLSQGPVQELARVFYHHPLPLPWPVPYYIQVATVYIIVSTLSSSKSFPVAISLGGNRIAGLFPLHLSSLIFAQEQA